MRIFIFPQQIIQGFSQQESLTFFQRFCQPTQPFELRLGKMAGFGDHLRTGGQANPVAPQALGAVKGLIILAQQVDPFAGIIGIGGNPR